MPLPNSLNEENRQPTKAYILETMQHWITVMQLRPGEKISDTEIAEYFNVSRTPVREVLKMLEQQKLIYIYPGRATVVADLALDDIESYYLPMQTLQCLAVRLAVNKAPSLKRSTRSSARRWITATPRAYSWPTGIFMIRYLK